MTVVLPQQFRDFYISLPGKQIHLCSRTTLCSLDCNEMRITNAYAVIDSIQFGERWQSRHQNIATKTPVINFLQALLEDIDTQLVLESEPQQFNWRDELVEVVEPLLSSLKSMTKRPRQIAELRKSINLDTRKLAIAEEALATANDVSIDLLNEGASLRLKATREKWSDARNLINERLMNSQS